MDAAMSKKSTAERQKKIERRNRMLAKHKKTDYSNAPNVERLGYKAPQAIVMGCEPMVLCLDDEGNLTCIAREEALGEFWIPTPEEIEQRKAEARQKFKTHIENGGKVLGGNPGKFNALKHDDPVISGIREVPSPRFQKRRED